MKQLVNTYNMRLSEGSRAKKDLGIPIHPTEFVVVRAINTGQRKSY
jgi:hypothetical protein